MKALLELGERSVWMDYDALNPEQHLDLLDMLRSRDHVTDTAGIPLLSDRANPPEDIDFEYTECPYTDSLSRYPDGQPSSVPMSGLERTRLMDTFPQIRRQLLATRAAYLGIMGLSSDHTLSSEDGINILNTMQLLPTYLTLRARKPVPIDRALPQHIVVGSNAASGGVAAVGAYCQGNTRLELPPGAVLLDAAENESDGGLVGDKTVCVAPTPTIRQFLTILRKGSEVVNYGSIEDETEGLLTQKEVPNALVLGANLESTLAYNTVLANADRNLYLALEGYNPRKHNERKIRSAISEFQGQLRFFVEGYKRIAFGANLALGRIPERPGEFDRLLEANKYSFEAIKLARSKGLNIAV